MMLRVSIALVCAAASVAAQAQVPSLPVINVTDGPDAGHIYLGDAGGPGLWSWNGSYGADVYPPSGNNAGNSPICDLLAVHGRPKDCDRSVVDNQTAGAPSLPTPSTWAGIGMSNQQAETLLFYCYSDPSRNPDDCEFDFKQSMAFACMGYFNYVYTDAGSPYYDCELGREELDRAILDARGYRRISEVFDLNVSPDIGVFEVNVNVPMFGIEYLSPFNRLLLFARKLDACSRWYNLWDRSHCSSNYDYIG